MHPLLQKIHDEAQRTAVRKKQIERLLSAHEIDTSHHTLLALLGIAAERATELSVPPPLILMVLMNLLGVQIQIVQAGREVELDGEESEALKQFKADVWH